ncbi:RNA-binding RNA annealing protein [Knufia obscura]|uniref:RNA-binding RNA annealing protein n=2 Tax=Knufia TaxID=430999 RepID=A0AAN8EN53_9EURO|nr:RNA-binding RNA annealing protein [Knufia obscura]KAK5948448.1 RNA-binding RNA annealing protein [Knufia fluminis]
MSARLDQSLDTIIDSQKKAKRTTRRNKPKTAPIGGVKKAIKPNRSAVKPATGPAARAPRNSKIVVSSLPFDVTENQIKEYFGKSVGPIKKVSLHYNQHGESRGIADISFIKPDSAAKAAKEQNGIKIDGRAMKVEVVVDASHAPEPAPVKSLADRVAANPKAQPKSATTKKNDPKAKNKAGKGKPERKAKNARPKPKTAEELDAEMTDYWAGGAGPAAGAAEGSAATGAAAPASDAMEEIS